MPRQYIHSTAIPGSTRETDAAEFLSLLNRAADIGMTEQDLEDELARRTGFEDAVRRWFRHKELPNGLVRRIILNCARQIVGSLQPD